MQPDGSVLKSAWDEFVFLTLSPKHDAPDLLYGHVFELALDFTCRLKSHELESIMMQIAERGEAVVSPHGRAESVAGFIVKEYLESLARGWSNRRIRKVLSELEYLERVEELIKVARELESK